MSGLELGESELFPFSKLFDPAEGLLEQCEVKVLALQTVGMV